MCFICDDPEEDGNQFFTCYKCHVVVHKYCYGVLEETENWQCSPCKMSINPAEIKCVLCDEPAGALKVTKCGNFVHVICALFTKNVCFMDVDEMEPVDVSNAARREKSCCFCGKITTFGVRCTKSTCTAYFHICCAQRSKALKEEVLSDDKINFRAFCDEHKKSNRRLSSKNVARAVRKSGSAELAGLKRTSSAANAEWILRNANAAVDSSQPPNKKSKPGHNALQILNESQEQNLNGTFDIPHDDEDNLSDGGTSVEPDEAPTEIFENHACYKDQIIEEVIYLCSTEILFFNVKSLSLLIFFLSISWRNKSFRSLMKIIYTRN